MTIEEAGRRPSAFFRGTRWRFVIREGPAALVKLLLRIRDLRALSIRPELKAAKIVAVLVVRDEGVRIPFILDYYRRLGVDHFVFVDNMSSDGTVSNLAQQPDVSVYRAVGSYRSAHYGNDWINAILTRHCLGKWILYIDADEFLVYDCMESHPLSDLIQWLTNRKCRSMHTLMIDLYDEGGGSREPYRVGVDPLEWCRLFDADGYSTQVDPVSEVAWTKGGVRRRMYFESWDAAPAINKTPLVRWCLGSFFLVSSHALTPALLNRRRSNEIPAGALLHQKFLDVGIRKMTDSDNRREHVPEYNSYDHVGLEQLRYEGTRTYRGPSDLIDCGLLAPISWDI